MEALRFVYRDTKSLVLRWSLQLWDDICSLQIRSKLKIENFSCVPFLPFKLNILKFRKLSFCTLFENLSPAADIMKERVDLLDRFLGSYRPQPGLPPVPDCPGLSWNEVRCPGGRRDPHRDTEVSRFVKSKI